MQEHEDAHEFLQKLQDLIDSHGDACKEDCKPVGAAMYGTFVQTITCRTVDYESRKVEGFYQLSVEVGVRPRPVPCPALCSVAVTVTPRQGGGLLPAVGTSPW